ncbi:MAG: RNA polymerase-binding protein DksA [Nitrospirae bacterium]|nr:RNA polymerase-binding protein DksA [Nitrospirota bacterium]
MATRKATLKTAKKKAVSASHTGKKSTSSQAKVTKRAPSVKEKVIEKKTTHTEVVVKKSAPTSSRDRKIHNIRLILQQQKDALLNGAEVALNELPGGQTLFPDMGDQASAETDMNFMLRLRGREQRLLKKIDEALERIDSGTFGICDDCGNEIDLKRLEARPVTTMCIECKTLQEEEEKRREV